MAALGAPLERVRRELIARGHGLLLLSEPAYQAAIEEAIRFLEKQACRVAVIGQVKAGKSSFINALIGRPNLLPSDVNPWTAVVTNLHFYHAAAASQSASFSFFDTGEWRRIAESGGPLRELTERLVPGFDLNLLSAQLESMRKRAEARLGSDFASLMGQRHDYPTVSPELIARYVSAGTEEDIGQGGAGWYSEVTKSADLYFAGDRSGFPLTIVDTPGTNDPLLVRDEVTRLSLASADIYVIVLTAQQPLSIGDMALLRLLRGLHKERIVIFINRIDSLRDIAGGAARVAVHVRTRLLQEFPSTRFPIILGSAHWANSILSSDSVDVSRMLDASFRAYASSRGHDRIEPIEPGRPPSGEAISSVLSLSGIPAVTAAIGDLMLSGNTAHAIRQLAAFFAQVARSSEVSSRAQWKAAARAFHEARAGSESRAAQIKAWSEELEQIESAARELQSNLALYEASLHNLVERCAADLRLLLGRCLAGFTEQQVAVLARAYRAGGLTVWSCDSNPLRDALQNEFLRVYRFWEARLSEVGALMRQQLEALVPLDALKLDELHQHDGGEIGGQQPSVAALGQVVALDLTMPWWKAWWYGRPSLESRVAELRRLIGAEFEPLIAELIEAAKTALSERSQYSSRQARMGTLDIVSDIHRRSAELVAGLRQAGSAPDAETIARLEQGVHKSEAALARWVEMREALSRLVEACEAVVGDRRAAGPPPENGGTVS